MLKIAFCIIIYLFLIPISPVKNRKKYLPLVIPLILGILVLFTFKSNTEILTTSEYTVSDFSQIGNNYFIGVCDENGNKQVLKVSKYHDIVKISNSSSSPKKLIVETYTPTKLSLLFDFRQKVIIKYLLT